jgi:hypothetical protein
MVFVYITVLLLCTAVGIASAEAVPSGLECDTTIKGSNVRVQDLPPDGEVVDAYKRAISCLYAEYSSFAFRWHCQDLIEEARRVRCKWHVWEVNEVREINRKASEDMASTKRQLTEFFDKLNTMPLNITVRQETVEEPMIYDDDDVKPNAHEP